MSKNKPSKHSNNTEKKIHFNDPLEKGLYSLLSELPRKESFKEELFKEKEEDFKKYIEISKKFLAFLLQFENKNSFHFIEKVILFIKPENLRKINPHLPDFAYPKLSSDLLTGLLAYLYKNGINNNYPITGELKQIDAVIESSGLSSILENIDNQTLQDLNNNTVISLIKNKTRDIPMSYIIEIPFLGETKFWVLYNQKGDITQKNIEKLLKNKDAELLKPNIDITNIKDSFVTVFFGEKEPSDLKIKSIENTKSTINVPIFRDEIGTFTLYSGIYKFEALLEIGLKNIEKLRALIFLGLAPVLLKKDEAEKIYSQYGIHLESNKKDQDKKDSGENHKSDGKRNYPYSDSIRFNIEDLMEDDDKKETNTRVTHKRLLPLIRRPDGSYSSLKPSLRSKELAPKLGYELREGLGFPESGKCIYPERIEELIKQLGVNTIEEALNTVSLNGEKVYLRYETIVIPTKEIVSEQEIKDVIRGRVSQLIK